jgi:hypothetical protein
LPWVAVSAPAVAFSFLPWVVVGASCGAASVVGAVAVAVGATLPQSDWAAALTRAPWSGRPAVACATKDT